MNGAAMPLCQFWPQFPVSERECCNPAQWSMPSEASGVLYLCEDCRIRTGTRKEPLTELSPPQETPKR